MNRFMLPLIAVIILIPILVLGLRSDPSALPSQYIGKSAPTFELPTLKNPNLTFGSADLKGQTSIVNIWATWCAGCRTEHQFLVELDRDSNIPIYGINWRDSRQAALAWLSELGDPYAVSGFDSDARVGIDWGAYGAPETFLVDSGGTVIYRFTGPLNWDLWEQEFVPRIEDLASNE